MPKYSLRLRMRASNSSHQEAGTGADNTRHFVCSLYKCVGKGVAGQQISTMVSRNTVRVQERRLEGDEREC
jgi:hypothetical protein